MTCIIGGSHGSNQDHWCEIFGQQWNTAASQTFSADSKFEGAHGLMAKCARRNLTATKLKRTIFQLIIKLDVMVVASLPLPSSRVLQVICFLEIATTWCTCGTTLHCKDHAGKSSNGNAAGDPDSPKEQVQISARIQAELCRVRMQHCCRQQYWLSSRYRWW